jgi:hypothetical protein
MLEPCSESFWDALQKDKYKSLKVRAVSTVIIIASFSVIIYLGHVPLMLMILAIQVLLTATPSCTGLSACAYTKMSHIPNKMCET